MEAGMSKKQTGRYGEQLAAQYLLGKGYQVLATNWHCVRGELDIIAQDGETVVFVEVRTRRAAAAEDIFTSITPRKRQRLIDSAYTYLAEQQLENSPWRIDVIAISLAAAGAPAIEHVEDALDW